ncbi:hypothetical protein [Roseovarius aestuarii]|uniref:Uncharacterized protein n=1 Tax=Roseovarius aestuarii TaxID=475083 RepID=A0A1X7BVP2_9RHOB|nr:hypothetical protein [Roseovarius aestuarii]SMC13732.1 hypothetical protein ROA7745_03591 [Roseovarius aestuarii]
MDTEEILVRTMNASKEAREHGFLNTAEAFDGIVDSLLQLMNSQTLSIGEKRVNSLPDTLQRH